MIPEWPRLVSKNGAFNQKEREVKICNKCFEAKPDEEFFKNPRMLSGRYNTCRTCYNADKAKYRKKAEYGDPTVNSLMRAWR